MAGSELAIGIEYDDTDVQNMLQRLFNATNELEPAFRDIGESLLLSHDERFSDQTDPFGNNWEPLSSNYQSKKPKNSDKILIYEGDLRDSLHYQESSDQLLFGTNSIYGATHQFGRPEANIPARPFLGVSDQDKEDIIEIVMQFFEDSIK